MSAHTCPNPMHRNTVFTVREIARAIKATPQYVRAACASGELDAVKVAGRWLVGKAAFTEWLVTHHDDNDDNDDNATPLRSALRHLD